MKEAKWIVIIVALSTIVSILVYFFTLTPLILGQNIVADYTVVYDPYTGILEETFVYHVYASYEYTMLYRYWEAPLTLKSINEPHIRFLSIECPSSSIGYVKDYRGKVYMYGPLTYASVISARAYRSEAGCYFPAGIPAGDYVLKLKYLASLPAEYDGRYYHLNFKLAERHITYTNVEVRIKIPSSAVERIYVHTPTYTVTHRQDTITVSGSSMADQLLEIELVLKPNDYLFFEIPYNGDILERTERANSSYTLFYNGIELLVNSLRILVIGFPVIIVLLYLFRGREKKYVVPQYLSYVPNRNRKPWEVDLLFNGDATSIGANALYATILDLNRRGIIDIEVKAVSYTHLTLPTN